MQIINDTKVYTLAEVAELIGVTYQTAQRYVNTDMCMKIRLLF